MENFGNIFDDLKKIAQEQEDLIGLDNYYNIRKMAKDNIDGLSEFMSIMDRSDLDVINEFIELNDSLGGKEILDVGKQYWTKAGRLAVLNISSKKIKTIPKNICNLNELKGLWLNINNIESIPKEIGYLKKLRLLHLGGNQISEIPNEILELQDLKKLILFSNKIKKLPQNISRLNLDKLDLGRNNLKQLPKNLKYMKNCHINVEGNRLSARYHFSNINEAQWGKQKK